MILGFKRVVDGYGVACVCACVAETGEPIGNEQACTVESSVTGATIVTLRYVVMCPTLTPTPPTTETPK